jgi:hypothetical protein
MLYRAHLTNEKTITPRFVAALTWEALKGHSGDEDAPMRGVSLSRTEADVFGNANGPGCFDLHHPATVAQPKPTTAPRK